MKVLLVSSNSGSHGGGELYLQKLAGGLSRLGHDVHVLLSASAHMDPLAEGTRKVGATVHRLPLTGTYERPGRSLSAVADISQIRRLSEFCSGLNPDLIHVNQQVAEDGLDYVLGAAGSKARVVSTIHIGYSSNELGARLGLLRDQIAKYVLARFVDRIILVSQASRDLVSARLNGRTGCEFVANGVGDAIFLEPCTRAVVRSQLSLQSDDVAIGVVGRLAEQKNPLFVADLLRRLLDRGLPVKLVWVGDGHLRQQMADRLSDLGVADRAYISGWREDVPRLLAAIDIVLLPSLFEGMPLALLEALRAGLPVCASDIEGVREVVSSGRDGYLCAVNALDAWTEDVARLVSDQRLRQRIGAAARTTGDAFSVENMSARTLDVYRHALDGQPRTR